MVGTESQINHPRPLLIKEESKASQTQVRLAAGTCVVSKRSKLVFNACIERSIWVCFEFVFTCLSLFSITYWLRSYCFMFFQFPDFPRDGTVPPSLAARI